MIAGIYSDLKHGFRLHRETPWQSALMVVMIATAMTLVASTASLWSGLYLSGTPGVESDRGIVSIGLRDGSSSALFNLAALEEFSASTQTLESVSAVTTIATFSAVDFEGEPLDDHTEAVYPGYFETLKPRMYLGLWPAPSDLEGEGARILVLSYRFWRERLGGDPDILQKELQFAGTSWRVAGVADREFTGLREEAPALWAPWRRFYTEVNSNVPERILERSPVWRSVGRTLPGIRLSTIEAELEHFVKDYTFPGRIGPVPEPGQVLVMPGVAIDPSSYELNRRQSSLLLTASVLFATITAVNMGLFLLSRAPGRLRELTIRKTLGASTSRLARQLVTEVIILVLLAMIAGVVLSIWVAALIADLAFASQAGLSNQLFNLPTLGLTAGLAATLVILVALFPIAVIGRSRLGQQVHHVSARPVWFQHCTGLVQLSVAGLVGGVAFCLIAHTLVMETRDRGLSTDQILIAKLTFKEHPGSAFQPPGSDMVYAFRDRVRERLKALPDLRAVSFARPVPGEEMRSMWSSEIDGQTIHARSIVVAPGFFDMLGIPVLHGRGLDYDDEVGVVISRTFAERAWGETEVVGRFVFPGSNNSSSSSGLVLGVVEDVYYDHPNRSPEAIVYSSGLDFAEFRASVMVSGNADPMQVKYIINEVLASHFDFMHVTSVSTLSDILRQLTRVDRARAIITGILGIATVLMAFIGFFGMQYYMVEVGMREIAIRMALGAGPRAIRRSILAQGLTVGLPGLVIGGLLSTIAVAGLADNLLGSSIPVVAVIALVMLLLLTLMLIASVLPAKRASRLSLGDLLKEE